MIANLFWSMINLAPIFIFCYRHVNPNLIYIFGAIALSTALLPKKFFDAIQLNKSKRFYKRAGVSFINKFAQNGELINKLVRRKFPQHKIISGRGRPVKKLIAQTYMLEKFHFMMFMLFMFVIVYALSKAYWLWALIIFINNIIYNVYPNLLQQYIRVKLKAFERAS